MRFGSLKEYFTFKLEKNTEVKKGSNKFLNEKILQDIYK